MEWKGFGGERDLCQYNIPAFPTVTEKSHNRLNYYNLSSVRYSKLGPRYCEVRCTVMTV
jgi:hypothetical protein